MTSGIPTREVARSPFNAAAPRIGRALRSMDLSLNEASEKTASGSGSAVIFTLPATLKDEGAHAVGDCARLAAG